MHCHDSCEETYMYMEAASLEIDKKTQIVKLVSCLKQLRLLQNYIDDFLTDSL